MLTPTCIALCHVDMSGVYGNNSLDPFIIMDWLVIRFHQVSSDKPGEEEGDWLGCLGSPSLLSLFPQTPWCPGIPQHSENA